MDHAAVSLQSVLVLLASSVAAVALCRSLRLPPIVGYLATGLALGPHAAGLVSNREETRHLAEFGVVFLMFSIGLEFSLPKLLSMRRQVFGLGMAQVAATMVLVVAACLALGASWQTGIALGGIVATVFEQYSIADLKSGLIEAQRRVEAAERGELKHWTQALTGIVVGTFAEMGWRGAWAQIGPSPSIALGISGARRRSLRDRRRPAVAFSRRRLRAGEQPRRRFGRLLAVEGPVRTRESARDVLLPPRRKRGGEVGAPPRRPGGPGNGDS